MYGELYQYLLLYRQLDLPGIGTLIVERKPACLDIADKVISPQSFTISLLEASNTPAKRFFHWLGSKFGISELDAVIRFNDFLYELKKELSAGHKLQWSGVGTISKVSGGNFNLESSLDNHAPGWPVPATKVIRENAEHIIRVGEQQKTSGEMKEILYHPEDERRRSYWGVAALVIVIISVIFIGYYFSVNGLNTSAAANQQRLVPQAEKKTH